jgi:hypothetical protein
MTSNKMADRYNLNSESVTCHSKLCQFKTHNTVTVRFSSQIWRIATCNLSISVWKSCYKSLQKSSYTDTVLALSLITLKILRFRCMCSAVLYLNYTKRKCFRWYSHLCVRGVSNGGMTLAGKYRITRWKNLSKCHFLCHKTVVPWPGIEHGSLLWKACD